MEWRRRRRWRGRLRAPTLRRVDVLHDEDEVEDEIKVDMTLNEESPRARGGWSNRIVYWYRRSWTSQIATKASERGEWGFLFPFTGRL